MYSDEFVKFLSENFNLFDKTELYEPLALFFLLKNLYHNILPQLQEFSVVDEATFNHFIGLNSSQNNYYTSCLLLSENNCLLKESQKKLLGVLLELKPLSEGENSSLKFLKIFYFTEDESRNSLLVSESNLYHIVRLLVSILGNQNDELDSNRSLALDRCREYIELVKNKEPSFELNSVLEDVTYYSPNYKVVNLSLCFFLLHINPSFSGVSRSLIKSLNNRSRTILFNSTLIVNNLIRLHPKESNLWEIKSVLTELWFKRFRIRVKRFILLPIGCFLIRRPPPNLLYSYLIKTIYSLFKDRFLILNQGFVAEILYLKPFNNSVVSYLHHEYDCIVRYVVGSFMKKVKEFGDFRYLRKFGEFHYMNPVTRYRITIFNGIFKYLSLFYRRLLKKFGFPSLFFLYLNFLKRRKYAIIPSSVIIQRWLYPSCFLYTRPDLEFENSLALCDDMIRKDCENCWIDNKSKLLFQLLDLKRALRPFWFDEQLVNMVFKLKVLYVLEQHLSTWLTFTSKLTTIYSTNFKSYIQKRKVKLRKKHKFEKRVKLTGVKPDEYKSEATSIRKLVYRDSSIWESSQKDGVVQVFYKPRFIYLESFKVFEKFSILQVDHILNSFSQLLYLLFNLFRRIKKLKKRPNFCLNLSCFNFLFKVVEMVCSYSRLVPKLGKKVSLLVGLGWIKRMSKWSSLVLYKYHNIRGIQDVPYSLELILSKLALLLLSAPFRFYLHWVVSSKYKLDLLNNQIKVFK